ncbi:D-alanyl-D-alanine carboxypeptidase [Isoptericola sp. CG 20/1183]|uniref:D-alanyl-D-alanine carboxypeptidase n=1 Tax=Isoptericola halotolerans TaxID=300560 RepID=A0ABX5EIT5_9MICO|nr:MULTISPECIES: M15 family metallopeptidase [Isoptericola]PRZ08525.1 D-alanyl-D-alanine carboxypeptidase [Isoptericola halotolerans]PRZ11028.1 D-alanyl-D-alanine carboxypeptidase [Isoptericola sp. CG 20/1183]
MPRPASRRRAARTLLAAAVLAALGWPTTAGAAEVSPAGPPVAARHVPLPEATTITGWRPAESGVAGEHLRDVVLVSPARGRELEVQQQVGGTWVTRQVLRLADGEVDVTDVPLTRHWTHDRATRWRLAVGGSGSAAPAVSGVKVVTASWEAADDPRDPAVLVNKRHPVQPRSWEPDRLVRPALATAGSRVRLRPVAADALAGLATAARKATGKELVLVSGYRSAGYQERLHDRYVRGHGAEAAERFSARAGHSEHQTGLAADVTQAGVDLTRFGGTPSSDWVAAHAWRHGFVVRYTAGDADVTGYAAEPWHLRYVGPDLAAYVHHTGLTLEEALGAEAAPDYLG